MKIAVDAMGGDYAPDQIVLGACQAVKLCPVEVILVGIETKIRESLQRHGCADHSQLSIVHAPEVVEMAESPTHAFKKKPQSSIRVGLELVKSGEVAGFLSAGNTGACLAASLLILGKIANVERPAVATVLPSLTGKVVMLDMGTNVDCRASHLRQFAQMGYYYAKMVVGIPEPRVGLLNIGEEEGKGNELTLKAYPLLQELPFPFAGNIEGKEVLRGKADVIVCDGFTGNSLLKFGEGIVEIFSDFFKTEARRSILGMVGGLCLYPSLKKFKKQFDYHESGAAPLLGVNGLSFIAHGSSDARAIRNGIQKVYQAASSDIINAIAKAVEE